MKTRSQIYADEKEIINILSMYQALSYEQLYKFLSNKSKQAIEGMLKRLHRGNRLYSDRENGYVYYNKDLKNKADTGILQAVWLLLEFLDKVTYHTKSSYPAIIFFMTEKSSFEIVKVAYGEETALNAYFIGCNREDDTKRIIIVDDVKQIPGISIPNIAGYCTVSHDGQVNYFKY